MRPIAADDARSVVCVSVCLCVGHTGVLCRNNWTDRSAVWGLTYMGSRNHALELQLCGSQRPCCPYTASVTCAAAAAPRHLCFTGMWQHVNNMTTTRWKVVWESVFIANTWSPQKGALSGTQVTRLRCDLLINYLGHLVLARPPAHVFSTW